MHIGISPDVRNNGHRSEGDVIGCLTILSRSTGGYLCRCVCGLRVQKTQRQLSDAIAKDGPKRCSPHCRK